jgi:spore germination protein YaaH
MLYRQILFLLAPIALMAQTKAIFYMTARPDSVRSFLAHAKQVDILIPEVYSTDEQGFVWGVPDPQVLETARKQRVPVMPIIVNPGFKQETIHGLLGNAAAQARLTRTLLEECRRYRYYGIQFDFENIAASDRDALTALLRETARVFAPQGFKLSIATVHKASEYPGRGDYAHWLHVNWRGAYDLAEIAKIVDFLSVMTYDQHTGHTPPGPVAGFPWVQEALDYSLKVIPKEKLSLGIPLYGRRWYAGMREKEAAMLIASVNAPEAVDLAAQMKVAPQWDAAERAPWFHFYRDGVREYVFYNDARSVRERYELAKQHGLHSFSAWVLGAEDPEIWNVLPAARR